MRGVQPSSVLEQLQKHSRRRHKLGRRSVWHARRRQKYRRLTGTQSAGGLRLALAADLHAPGMAGMAVGNAGARASVSANVHTLIAAIGISMPIEVVLC